MASWHQTIIVGNVGNSPEIKYLQSGAAVCSFSVAVNEVWYDKNTNEKSDKTTWYRVSCWQKMAETANQYVRKGMQIMIVGTVSVNAYTNNAGEAAASLELAARDMKFLGRARRRQQDEQHSEYDGNQDSDIPF